MCQTTQVQLIRGETTPAPGNLADRDFTAEMRTRNGPRTSPDQARVGRACLSPPVDCHDGRIVAYTAGSGPTPGSPTGCSSRPRKRCRRERIPWRIPTADATAGGPDGWRSWTATARHGRRAPKAVPRTTPPRRVLRTHEDGIRLSRALGGATRDGVLVLIDDCIRWHDHERIKRSLGWMSPVQCRQSQGMAA